MIKTEFKGKATEVKPATGKVELLPTDFFYNDKTKLGVGKAITGVPHSYGRTINWTDRNGNPQKSKQLYVSVFDIGCTVLLVDIDEKFYEDDELFMVIDDKRSSNGREYPTFRLHKELDKR